MYCVWLPLCVCVIVYRDKKKLEDEKDGLNSKLEDTLGEVKKLKKEISDNREELRQVNTCTHIYIYCIAHFLQSNFAKFHFLH